MPGGFCALAGRAAQAERVGAHGDVELVRRVHRLPVGPVGVAEDAVRAVRVEAPLRAAVCPCATRRSRSGTLRSQSSPRAAQRREERRAKTARFRRGRLQAAHAAPEHSGRGARAPLHSRADVVDSPANREPAPLARRGAAPCARARARRRGDRGARTSAARSRSGSSTRGARPARGSRARALAARARARGDLRARARARPHDSARRRGARGLLGLAPRCSSSWSRASTSSSSSRPSGASGPALGGPYRELVSRGRHARVPEARPPGLAARLPQRRRRTRSEPRGPRLLFLGDSYTEGSGRDAACNYPEVATAALNERARGRAASRRSSAMNAGVAGYGPEESLALLRFLREEGYRFDAVVLSIFVENDFSDDLPGTERRVVAGINFRFPRSPFLRWLHPLNTRTARYAMFLWQAARIGPLRRRRAARRRPLPAPAAAPRPATRRRFATSCCGATPRTTAREPQLAMRGRGRRARRPSAPRRRCRASRSRSSSSRTASSRTARSARASGSRSTSTAGTTWRACAVRRGARGGYARDRRDGRAHGRERELPLVGHAPLGRGERGGGAVRRRAAGGGARSRARELMLQGGPRSADHPLVTP